MTLPNWRGEGSARCMFAKGRGPTAGRPCGGCHDCLEAKRLQREEKRMDLEKLDTETAGALVEADAGRPSGLTLLAIEAFAKNERKQWQAQLAEAELHQAVLGVPPSEVDVYAATTDRIAKRIEVGYARQGKYRKLLDLRLEGE